jgi:hypothetical protein
MVRAAIGRLWRRRVSAWVLGIALGGPVVHLLQLSAAMAAPPRQAAASTRQKTKAAPGPRAKARTAAARTAAPSAAPPAAALAPSNAGAAHPSTPPDAAPAGGAKPGAPEAPVTAPGAAAASDVVRTEEREGEKTYTFGAQEVEGRLKSPQILYFLRRVRAQFDPAPLGHRSFLLELSDTRRHPALE